MIALSGGEEGEDGVVDEDEDEDTDRSMESFPVGYHHPAVDDCRIEGTNPLV